MHYKSTAPYKIVKYADTTQWHKRTNNTSFQTKN